MNKSKIIAWASLVGILSAMIGPFVVARAGSWEARICGYTMMYGGALVGVGGWIYLLSRLTQTRTRPTLRVWEHDGETLITTEEIYLISLALTEQIRRISSNPKRVRVKPLIYAFWSPRRVHGLSRQEFQAILNSCSAQDTEMQFPMTADGYFNVGFTKLWQLVHGSNSKPPLKFPAETPPAA
jgi:hypothetical protein